MTGAPTTVIPAQAGPRRIDVTIERLEQSIDALTREQRDRLADPECSWWAVVVLVVRVRAMERAEESVRAAARLASWLEPWFGVLDAQAMAAVVRPRGPECQPGIDLEIALLEEREGWTACPAARPSPSCCSPPARSATPRPRRWPTAPCADLRGC